MPKGRIVKGIGGYYSVDLPERNETFICQARGKFRIDGITPTIGDFVEISITDNEKKTGYLLDIMERKNELIRPKAANIDLIILVFAVAKPELNFDLLDNYFILTESITKGGTLDILLCINKIDLGSNEKIEKIAKIYKNAGYDTLCISAINGQNDGIQTLKEKIKGKVSIVAGPSGVGKSSILNIIAPQKNLQTGEISKKIQRGKHTTRHVELFTLGENTYIADSPGFSSLSVDSIPKDKLQYCYKEFEPYIGKCFYNDCGHVSEPDCAVKAQIGKTIDKLRYDRYVSLYMHFKC